MKSKLPALAEWLLTRFGIPQQNESLMGDLAEESRSGRSALWLWRETMVAIGTTVARDIRLLLDTEPFPWVADVGMEADHSGGRTWPAW